MLCFLANEFEAAFLPLECKYVDEIDALHGWELLAVNKVRLNDGITDPKIRVVCFWIDFNGLRSRLRALSTSNRCLIIASLD